MSKPDLIIRAHRVVTPEGIGPASVYIDNGKIAAVESFTGSMTGCTVIDVGEDSVLMPGLVDTHVHINEPGRTDWEGFETATRAAAAGGVTTLVEMPLNSIPPTTTLEGLTAKLEAARGKCHVDVGFWGGVVPGNVNEIQRLHDAGALGFKCFLVDSGVEEFPRVGEADLRKVLPELVRLNAVLIVHAETPRPIEEANARLPFDCDARKYFNFLASRPKQAENDAVALMIRLSREFKARIHIVHHSSAEALPILRQAREEGLPVTVETCPHYLAIAAESIPDGATEFKCCPPIRERANGEELWSALKDGIIDMIVSDHSPCPPEMKQLEAGNFMEAWGGISSLQFRLSVVWAQMLKRGLTFNHLAEWLCRAPARLVGLEQQKGAIVAGCDADLVIWNPSAQFRIEPSIIQHRHKLTPYNGQILSGVVEKTFLRGEKIYDNGEFSKEASGEFLLRGNA